MKIKLTVERFEGDRAVLKFPDGSIVSWPLHSFPPEMKPGGSVNFIVSENGKMGDSGLAKAILNEIINTDG